MALVKFLKSGQLKPPRAVTAAAKKDARGVGGKKLSTGKMEYG